MLIEKPGRHPGQLGGRSPYLQAVHVEGPAELIGTVQPVDILSVGPNSLAGRLLDAGRAAAEASTPVAERLAS